MGKGRPSPIVTDLSSLPRPKFEELDPHRVPWTLKYDAEYDTVMVVIGAPRPAISVDVDGMWVRMDSASGEILGFEIEDFASVFVPAHPELQRAKTTRRRFRQVPSGDPMPMAWLMNLIEYIKRAISGSNHHGKFSPA